MRLLLPLLCCIFLSCINRPAVPLPMELQRAPSSSASNSDLSLGELRTILQERKYSRIDDLLADLAKRKPEYMSHYTLGFRSQSLHGSSKEFPRAIVFGQEGKFIITFNGHRNQDAYDRLEVVEFNSQKRAFEYREIQFNDLGALSPNEPYRISGIGGPRGKCLQCHTNSRPIWEVFPVWPGFYGGDGDEPIGERFSQSPALGVAMDRGVHSEWENFQRSALRKGRYRFLHPLANSRIFGTSSPVPNSDLTFLITQHNFQRIGRILGEHIDPNFRAAYLWASSCLSLSLEKRALPPTFQALEAAYGKKYSEAALEHQLYRAEQLATDIFADRTELRVFWGGILATSGAPVPPAKAPLEDLLRPAFKVSSGVQLGVKVEPEFRAVVALTEKYFPQAKPETWPSALYEGVHRYDASGNREEGQWLVTAIIENLYPENERANIRSSLTRDRRATCTKLEKQFPSTLTR